MNWAEFFSMGGYALYVWSSYAAAAAVLLLNIALPLRRRDAVLNALREFYRLKGRSR